MAVRRRPTATVHCAHPGCRESGFFEYDTLAERREGSARRASWKCSRHLAPEEILSGNCLSLEKTMVVQGHPGAPGNYFDGRSGFASGPGFKVWADDFPSGTKLIVTARIELPKEDGEWQ